MPPLSRRTSSTPTKARAQSLLTSPAAARRSHASMEAFKVARALKEGLAQLKARADPQRAFSAAASSTATLPRARLLVDMPRYGSFSSDSSDGPPPAADLLRARPVALHHASRSCPHRARALRSPPPPPPPPPRFSLSDVPPDHPEAAEAAEAMILFMRSEPSSQGRPSPATPPVAPLPRGRSPASDAESSIYVSDAESTDCPSPPAKRTRPDHPSSCTPPQQ
ncbi:hypothetical protein H4R18_005736 [Coemansia javaensis]|uniref:Uncharacterized protein n=1 Tax=Coemansia javaensis TaxID=2761396 RepID=A0A9W8LF45_9FUNG|nr:hypothetical protein H4R18_005736 [Coemansia javaensis]